MLLWITGSKGQLGSSLAEICKGKIDTIQTGREVDIGNPKDITEFVKNIQESPILSTVQLFQR